MQDRKLDKNNLINLSIYSVVLLISGLFLKNIKYGIVIFLMILIFGMLILVANHSKRAVYICKICGKSFKLSVSKDLFSPHKNQYKYMKCPYCNSQDWHEEIR